MACPWRLSSAGCRRRRRADLSADAGEEEAPPAKRRCLARGLAAAGLALVSAGAGDLGVCSAAVSYCPARAGLAESAVAMVATLAAIGSVDLLKSTFRLARRRTAGPGSAARPQLSTEPRERDRRRSGVQAAGRRQLGRRRPRGRRRGMGRNAAEWRALFLSRRLRRERRQLQRCREREAMALRAEAAESRLREARTCERLALVQEQCELLQERYAQAVALLEHRAWEAAELRLAWQAGLGGAAVKEEPASPSTASGGDDAASISASDARARSTAEASDFQPAPSTPSESAKSWRGVLRRSLCRLPLPAMAPACERRPSLPSGLDKAEAEDSAETDAGDLEEERQGA
mmetsp:Transcript_33767/g.105226  ORF Transcript_33767/g.105226 Transcript_33767/m.105226 type:complete len:347 (+) Transcript_33767:47-1087(+)